jgi:hypothetical protein
MPKKRGSKRPLPPAARVFGSLQADDALLSGEVSALRRSGALLLALLVLAAVPLYLAANAAGLIGDAPAAVAKSNSGPGGGDDDDNSGPGGGDDDDTGTSLKTDDTSRNGHSTRGTTNDNDTRTRLGTNDTSRNGHSTRGTTRDNDTNTRTGTGTGTQTRTRTGS